VVIKANYSYLVKDTPTNEQKGYCSQYFLKIYVSTCKSYISKFVVIQHILKINITLEILQIKLKLNFTELP
jgi:hypothetical protein